MCSTSEPRSNTENVDKGADVAVTHGHGRLPRRRRDRRAAATLSRMTAFGARSRELEVGESLGPYRLDELLGAGGAGLVFRARREPDGQVVALKTLRQALSADETFRRRFNHEARAAAEVSHPNLVPILDAGELDGRQYLAMALVRGPTLEGRIAGGGPLAPDEVVALAGELGAALDALHGRGIMHRDVKPSNVLFAEDGTALLTDFGLAKGRDYTALTAAGQVFGSLHYVAPELIRGQPATPASDVYALGCVLYEAATGAPPFAAADPVEIGVGHLRREPPDPQALGVDWAPALSAALLRALAKDPDRRPPSGADYARGLRTAGTAAPPREPRPARVELAGYQIVRKLGHGAAAAVWEGRHLRLGHRAALKVFETTSATDDEARDSFVLESRLVAAIDHPNIIPIYDCGAEDGVLYIAMRLVDGGDLDGLIRAAAPLQPERALAIAEQVAAALDAMHARGLVHRDVKPANILIDDLAGSVFLSDFGTAHRPRRRAAAAGVAPFAGTLGYAAPEQLDGKAAGPAADVYALGCVLYECLTARRPFVHDSDVAVLYAHLLDPPPRVADVRPQLPRELDAVFARALAKTQHDRFATCGDLIVAAREALGIAGAARAPAGASPRAEQPAAAARLPRSTTPLVGRERELDELEALLSSQAARLVTLTGPGGSGKTRLAVEAAHAVQDRFRDGVLLVAVDGLSDAALVPRAIADALGLEERAMPDGDALVRGLQRRLERAELLLVLDGFERVLPAAPLVAGLLGAATGLAVLVTSQAPLRVQGEHELPVAPLELDAAVRLFVDRARAVQPGFAPDAGEAGAIAEICRRLDGLPLAVELAAARTKVLSPRAIVARLENRLELLTGGARDLPARHRTLRGAIDWTHELLDADEQALLARASVFEGGFAPEDAEAVCNPGRRAMLDALASLVDKSLLMRRRQPSGDVRLEMLQMIREYARYRLIERGERDELRRRHAEHYLAVAEAAEAQLQGPGQAAVVQRLEQDTANMRAALAWSLESGRVELGLRMAAALARFWSIRDQMTEGRAWLRRALARSASVAPAVRARGLFAAAYCALGQGDYVEAATGFEQSLETYRTLDDRRGQAMCLAQIGWLLLARGQLEQAVAPATHGLELARAIDDRATASVALADLAEVALRSGDCGRAIRLFEEVLVLRRALGDRRNLANALVNLGRAELVAGDAATAAGSLQEGLALAREVADTWGTSLAQISLARVALDAGDVAGARLLAAEALVSCRARGDRRTAAECLSLIALLAARSGRPRDGARLRSAAAALRAAMRAPAGPIERALDARPLGERPADAGDASADVPGFEQAIELALAATRRASAAGMLES